MKSARVIGHLLLPGEEGNLHGMPWDAWENGENKKEKKKKRKPRKWSGAMASRKGQMAARFAGLRGLDSSRRRPRPTDRPNQA